MRRSPHPSLTAAVLQRRLGELLHNPAFLFCWVVYAAASVADCVTTQVALAQGLRERNPLAAGLYQHAGAAGLWGLKFGVLAVILGGLALVPRRVAVVLSGVLAATMAIDVNANFDALRSIGI